MGRCPDKRRVTKRGMAAAYSLLGSCRGPYTLKKRSATQGNPYARVCMYAYSSQATFCAAYGETGCGGSLSCFGCSGASPYAAHEAANTTRSLFARTAACITLTVPPTFTALVRSGSLIEIGTDGIAARWKTHFAPATARATASGSAMLPSTSWKRGSVESSAAVS